MQKPLKFMAALGLVATMAFPAAAQDASTVIATVNGKDITLGHMIIARATLPEQLQQLPDTVLFDGILKQLIEQTVLADDFTGELPRRVTMSLENERRSLVAGERVEQILQTATTPELIQQVYDEKYAGAEPSQEFNAAHILVETEAEALDLVTQLEAGQEFAALAREHSTGPSGPSGGALGWFAKGAMVPAFEAAVVTLEVGGVSAPVQTQFGWHVVKLNETRSAGVPELAAVRSEIEKTIRDTVLGTTIEALVVASEVNRDGAEGIDPAILKNLALVE